MKQRLDSNNTETETYRKKIQNLMSENSTLGEEVRGAQENLRLSAGQMSKLQNEFKIMCAENEDLKQKVQTLGGTSRRLPEYESKIALLSQEVERLTQQLQKKTADMNNLTLKLSELDTSNQTVAQLQEKISRLVKQNSAMEQDMFGVQEQLRLSTNQNRKTTE